MSPISVSGRERAWGWVGHLAAGGTSPWAHWTQPGEATGRWLPGAQQLELLRRLNLAGAPPPELVRRVLAASAPGRGRPDLELAGADDPPTFGPQPVDPADLSDGELLRVAALLLAEDVVAAGRVAPIAPRGARGRRRRYVRYRLAGDPELAAPVRGHLNADGRPPGGTGAAVHVLGADLATMLGHAWTAGTFAEGGPSWPDYLAGRRRRPDLPRRIDLPAVADRWRARPDAGRVDIVLDLSALPGLVGVRGRLPEPPSVAAPAAELSRRVAGALGHLVTPPERTDLLGRVLRPRLAALPGAPVVVPPDHRDWVEERAAALRARVSAAGYPVVGDLDRLLPRWPDRPSAARADVVDVVDVVGLAVELLLEPLGGAKEVTS